MIIRLIFPLLLSAVFTLPAIAAPAAVQRQMKVNVHVVAPCAIDREEVRCSAAEHFNSRVIQADAAVGMAGLESRDWGTMKAPLHRIREVTF